VQLKVQVLRKGQWKVSILTRPEGRVQPFLCMIRSLPLVVSILTRPEGRVQHLEAAGLIKVHRPGFNPHPSRRTGATRA